MSCPNAQVDRSIRHGYYASIQVFTGSAPSLHSTSPSQHSHTVLLGARTRAIAICHRLLPLALPFLCTRCGRLQYLFFAADSLGTLCVAHHGGGGFINISLHTANNRRNVNQRDLLRLMSRSDQSSLHWHASTRNFRPGPSQTLLVPRTSATVRL